MNYIEKRVSPIKAALGRARVEGEEICEVQMSRVLVVKIDRSRVAYSMHGDGYKRPCDISPGCIWLVGCDGSFNRDLHTAPTSSVPNMGTFIRRGLPQPPITASQTLKAIWMWYDPLLNLNATGHDVSRLTLSGIIVNQDGKKLLRLSVPKKSGPWNAEILVSNSAPLSPQRVTLNREQEPRMILDIDHSVHPLCGDALASSKLTQMDEKGEFSYSQAAIVRSFTPNKTFDDSEFVVKFPIGTHLTEYTGDNRPTIQWIQATETEMKRLDPRDFGRADIE